MITMCCCIWLGKAAAYALRSQAAHWLYFVFKWCCWLGSLVRGCALRSGRVTSWASQSSLIKWCHYLASFFRQGHRQGFVVWYGLSLCFALAGLQRLGSESGRKVAVLCCWARSLTILPSWVGLMLCCMIGQGLRLCFTTERDHWLGSLLGWDCRLCSAIEHGHQCGFSAR